MAKKRAAPLTAKEWIRNWAFSVCYLLREECWGFAHIPLSNMKPVHVRECDKRCVLAYLLMQSFKQKTVEGWQTCWSRKYASTCMHTHICFHTHTHTHTHSQTCTPLSQPLFRGWKMHRKALVYYETDFSADCFYTDEHSRVVLPDADEDPLSAYINANYIRVSGKPWFSLCSFDLV